MPDASNRPELARRNLLARPFGQPGAPSAATTTLRGTRRRLQPVVGVERSGRRWCSGRTSCLDGGLTMPAIWPDSRQDEGLVLDAHLRTPSIARPSTPRCGRSRRRRRRAAPSRRAMLQRLAQQLEAALGEAGRPGTARAGIRPPSAPAGWCRRRSSTAGRRPAAPRPSCSCGSPGHRSGRSTAGS